MLFYCLNDNLKEQNVWIEKKLWNGMDFLLKSLIFRETKHVRGLLNQRGTWTNKSTLFFVRVGQTPVEPPSARHWTISHC